MLLDGLFVQWLAIIRLCKESDLANSVHMKHLYLPPADIQPSNLYEMLEFLLKRLFYEV